VVERDTITKTVKVKLPAFISKQKGHRQFDCSSVKTKNARTSHLQTQRAVSTAAPVTEVEAGAEVVALVNERDFMVKFSDPLRKVERICNRKCDL